MISFSKFASLALAALSLSACAVHNPKVWEPAQFPKASPAANKLKSLPAAGQKVAVAVYGFTDQTGQFKPTDGAQTLSRAVTQGATSILVKSLHEAGQRSWFTVIEREKLDNVLRERAVIREMRSSYLGEKSINPQALPPLLFAGVLFEGGIIGYDSNTKSGGSGARFLGIGGQTQYREDTVTVYLRAVSVKTGEVLSSVSMRKSIASIGVGASAFRYVAFKELLELESGISYNEPDQLALQQTIEASVFALIMEGAMQDLWCFNATPEEGRALLRQYVSERDSISDNKVILPSGANGQEISGVCQANQVASRNAASASQQITNVNMIPAKAPQQAVVQAAATSMPMAAKPVSEATVSNASVQTAVPASLKTVVLPPAQPAKSQAIAVRSTDVQSTPKMQIVKQPVQTQADPLQTVKKPAPKPAQQTSTPATAATEIAVKQNDCPAVFVARQPLPAGYKPSVGGTGGCNMAPQVKPAEENFAPEAAAPATIALSKTSVTAGTATVTKTALSSDKHEASLKGEDMD